MVFDKVRFFSTNNKDTDTFVFRSLFEKQRWINSLILDFSSICGMMVYKVEKSNVLMLLQTYWDLELIVSSKSFEFFNIHILIHWFSTSNFIHFCTFDIRYLVYNVYANVW
jgi:hypothetical protein